MGELISLKNVNFSFENISEPLIRRANLEFQTGEFALLSGPTGSGKSTLLKIINRLAPNFTGGGMSGVILVDGKDISESSPHEVAHLIGYVSQKPEDSFVTESVREELAYGMELLGFEPHLMCSNVTEVAKLVGIEPLLDAKLSELSGGEQQRVAIGAALAAGQRVLLLDEPSSSLDSKMAEDLVSLLRRLASEHGKTVILAEHRLERVLDVVDSVVMVHADGSVTKGSANSQFLDDRVAPPIISLSKRLGWLPLETNLIEARNRWQKNADSIRILPLAKTNNIEKLVALTVKDLGVSYSGKTVLRNLNFDLRAENLTVLMGANGSGKSSALWAIQGSGPRATGEVITPLGDSARLEQSERLQVLAMVPQKASDLLFLSTVSKELAEADEIAGQPRGTTGRILEWLIGRIDTKTHPRDLSSGQQLALVLAMQLNKNASVILLDEPTRGLDYSAKQHLAELLRKLKLEGKSILLASHDVEFIAQVADEIHILENGLIAKSGVPREILNPNSEYATQMGRISQLPGFLLVEQLVPQGANADEK